MYIAIAIFSDFMLSNKKFKREKFAFFFLLFVRYSMFANLLIRKVTKENVTFSAADHANKRAL